MGVFRRNERRKKNKNGKGGMGGRENFGEKKNPSSSPEIGPAATAGLPFSAKRERSQKKGRQRFRSEEKKEGGNHLKKKREPTTTPPKSKDRPVKGISYFRERWESKARR